MSGDPYDAIQDARSEARYEEDPRAEPDLSEIKDRAYSSTVFAESASDKYVGGKR